MEILAGLLASVVAFFGGAFGDVAGTQAAVAANDSSGEASESVELGISELSPRGHEGGYAVPASDSSGTASIDIWACEKGTGEIVGWTAENQNPDCTPTGGTRVISETDEVEITFRADNVYTYSPGSNSDACDVISGGGSGFDTSGWIASEGWVAGLDDTITEPSPASTTAFAVECTAADGSGKLNATVYVNTTNNNTNMDMDVGACDTDGTNCFEGQKNIAEGEDVMIYWFSYNATNGCVETQGPSDFSTSGLQEGNDDTVTEPPPANIEVFGVECSNGVSTISDTVNVHVSAQCRDGIDNSDPEDTLIDENDPGCHSDNDATDGDDTYVPTDNDETDATPAPECSDWIDNADPEDTLIDWNDPGCHTDGDATDGDATYDPNHDDETDAGLGSPPTVTLTINANGSGFVDPAGNAITVPPASNLDLRWNSNDANSCDETDDSLAYGFDVDGLSGTDYSITQPADGNSALFRVECTNADGSASDEITVTTASDDDLTPEYLRTGGTDVDGQTYNEGDDLSLQYRIENIGTEASEQHRVKLIVQRNEGGSWEYVVNNNVDPASSIPASDVSTEHSYDWTVPTFSGDPDDYRARVRIHATGGGDYDSDTDAVAENDYMPWQYFTVNAPLSEPNLRAINGSPSSGQNFVSPSSITFTGTAENNGDENIAEAGWGDVEIDWDSDGSFSNFNAFGGVKLGSMAIGETKPLSYTYSGGIPAGTHQYRFNVDVLDEVTGESSEADNRSPWRTFTVEEQLNFTLSASPQNLDEGGTTDITWTITQGSANSCTASNGSTGWSGSRSASGGTWTSGTLDTAGTITYTLTCEDGSDLMRDVTVTVNSTAGNACADAGLDADPSIVRSGDETTLTWTNSTDGAECVLTGGEFTNSPITTTGGSGAVCNDGTNDDVTDSRTVSPTNITTYTLTCDYAPDGSQPPGGWATTTTVQVLPAVDEN